MVIQKVQFTKGCPNGCKYCYEKPPVIALPYNDISIDLSSELVQILDMNILSNPYCKQILWNLPKHKYELVCGFDFRIFNIEIARLLKEKGFIKLRWAWDYNFSQQKIHKKVLQTLLKVGYKSKDLSVFMLVNWKIPYIECCQKLDLLKVWNVKVNDCCYDGGYAIAKPKDWDIDQIKKFRKMCRKHNQLVNFGIDPEYKSRNPTFSEVFNDNSLRK